MADTRISGYAKAILEIAGGEDELSRVESDLLAVGRVMDESSELSSTLTDPQLPFERKHAVIDDLIGGRASSLSVAIVQLIVSQGRASDLPQIVDAFVEAAAASRDRAVAEVRTAVPLDDETIDRLAKALGRATGKKVEVKLVIDPNVIGGVVARVGDTVIDGSIARRVESLRQAVKTR